MNFPFVSLSYFTHKSKPFKREFKRRMSSDGTSNGSVWIMEQNKAFENALALYFGEPDDRWETIAAAIIGKTREEIKRHYEQLVGDVNAIESGLVPLPYYESSSKDSAAGHAGGVCIDEMGSQVFQRGKDSTGGKRSSRKDQERRKGIPWTEEEHKLFLRGLEKYGKGDWRSISRYFVLSRTPTQVASHAQKYFIRLNSANNERRRSSIHDITNVDDGDMSGAPGSITGQMNAVAEAGCSTIVGISPPPFSAPAPAMYSPFCFWSAISGILCFSTWCFSEFSFTSADDVWRRSSRSWITLSRYPDKHGSSDLSNAWFFLSILTVWL